MSNNYIIIQSNDGTTSYAFKAKLKGYRPELVKTQRERYTATGKLDVQVSPTTRVWNLLIKLYGTSAGTFSISAGPNGIIQADSSVSWGTKSDFETLFLEDTPPNNKYRFQDFDGNDYYAYFSGRMQYAPLTTEVSGSNAYLEVVVTIMESKT